MSCTAEYVALVVMYPVSPPRNPTDAETANLEARNLTTAKEAFVENDLPTCDDDVIACVGTKEIVAVGTVNDDDGRVSQASATDVSDLSMEMLSADEQWVGALTTGPMQWNFVEDDVPEEVRCLCAGPVGCVRTNGDGTCSFHSILGSLQRTRRGAPIGFFGQSHISMRHVR